ncbi:nucleotidyltransferase domain-containing protein [Sphingobium sp. Sx8-8]|uniref:nucleotidyltransferase domain-containing protein n=1 Tax=Sphingobium sp. Sx8-8 TaxID=2933617 RepID=UPI001F575DCC|nr:nucleotidyltransferase domain-containing protein [Sphingobium sp. Sx8-8]
MVMVMREKMTLPADILEHMDWRAKQIAKDGGIYASRSAARRYVCERHPDAACAYLTGSYATGRPTPTSDLDVYVINNIVSFPLREFLIVDGYPIQATIMNSLDIHERISSSKVRREMGLLPAIEAAIFIHGSKSMFKRIVARARRVRSSAPRRDALSIRFYSTELLCHHLKLFRKLDPADRIDVVMKLVGAAGDLIQSREGVLRTSQAQYEPVLRHSNHYNNIISHVSKAIEGDVRPLMEATWDLLCSDEHYKYPSFQSEIIPMNL